MGKTQLIYVMHPSVALGGLYLGNAALVLNKGNVPYLAQGVVTMARELTCLPLSSSLITKGLEVP